MNRWTFLFLVLGAVALGGCGDDASDEGAGSGSGKQGKEEAKALMQRAQQELEASGLVDRAKNVGGSAPDVAFSQPGGGTVALADLRAEGPVVLAFYRGKW